VGHDQTNQTKLAIAAAIAALAYASTASAMTYFLTAQYYENGNNMCKYSDGSVLNMGAKVCPLSIQR
jgi:hypothetical protein